MKPFALSLCLLSVSLCASATATARDVRMHGPNGDGASNDTPVSATLAQPVPARQAPPVAPTHSKAKTPPLFRNAEDDAAPHAPRWHSFLPGMFR